MTPAQSASGIRRRRTRIEVAEEVNIRYASVISRRRERSSPAWRSRDAGVGGGRRMGGQPEGLEERLSSSERLWLPPTPESVHQTPRCLRLHYSCFD